MLSIDNIVCILKVAECLSINKASEFLYKTPSQVSRIVKNFEDEINLTVFERTTKGLLLTEDGQVIMQYLNALMKNYDDMLNYCTIKNDANKYHGVIDFYTSSNVQTNVYNALSAFNTNYPNIIINSHTVSSEKVLEQVLTKENTFGFLSQIYTEKNEPYYEIPLAADYLPVTHHDGVYLLCGKNNPLVQKYKTIPAKAIGELPLIDYWTFNDAPSYTSTILEVLDVDVQKFRYLVDDIRTLQQFLEKNLGVFVGVYSPNQPLSNKITGIPIKSKIHLEAGLVTKREQNNEIIQLLHDFLKDWYGDMYSIPKS